MLPTIKKIPHDKKIELVDGILTPGDIEYLYSPKRNMSYGWKANSKKEYDHGHWNAHIIGVKSPEDELKNIDWQYDPTFVGSNVFPIWNKLKRVFGERKILRCYFNGYTYGTEGYIHKDQTVSIPNHRQETILVYCTKEWKGDWAGETQFLTENQKEIVYSSLPLPNRALCFDSSIPHVARSVSRTYSGLRTILAFKTSVFNIDEETAIKFIQDLTQDTAHSKSTFFEHLYGTYKILKDMDMPQDVCMAGLFHAIYGTTYFKHKIAVKRETVRNLIGEYAENLVFEFCVTENRTPVLKELAKDGNLKHFHLGCIEYANLLEQTKRLNNKMTKDVNDLHSIIYD